MEDQVLDPVNNKKDKVVETKPVKKEPTLAPRLQAKLKELEKKGLLTTAKAYIPPQEMAALQASKAARAAMEKI